MRPPQLSTDTTPTIHNVLRVIDRPETRGDRCDTVILLQPTSPLRTAEDISACWKVFHSVDQPSVVSVSHAKESDDVTMQVNAEGRLLPLDASRREDGSAGQTRTCRLTGAVYINTVAMLRANRKFVTPGVTRAVVLPSERSVDIDTEIDLALAGALVASRPVKSIEISGRSIGNGSRCFIIAEAGVNHNGSLELAHRLVDQAADAGADAVKFQTFDPELLVARKTPMAEYQRVNTGRQQSQLEMLRQLALSRPAFQELARHATDRGIVFLSTAFDLGSADFLEDLGMAAYKVSSGDITNNDLLAHMARKGKPLLISTGMSTLSEVGDALAVARASGGSEVALFHCVTNYPALPGECNLRAMETMRQAFGVPVGWSDHTMGFHISLAAVASGAEILEKHFTLDCALPGPDHRASLEPRDFTALVNDVRAVEAASGDGVKIPVTSEAVNAALVRRSLHVATDLTVDHMLTEADLLALRPGTGIPPSARDHVIGRLLRVSLKAGELLREEHLA